MTTRAINEQILLHEARKDTTVYNRLVYRDDITGKPWETQPFQLEWEGAIEAPDEPWPLDEHGKPIIRLVLLAPAGHGKSQQFARSYITRKMGEATLRGDPVPRCVVLSNVSDQAEKRTMLVRDDIDSNERLRAVYPDLKRSAGGVWTSTRMRLESPVPTTDPHVQAIGIGGPLLGSRVDIGIVDDPCDMENTWTHGQRQKVLRWYLSTFSTRFDGRGTVIVIMTSWHEEDLGHLLVRDYGYRMLRYEACDENLDNRLWPSKFTEAKLRYMRDTEPGPIEFARTMRNIIMDDSFRKIKMDWIQAALQRGLRVKAGVAPKGAKWIATFLDPAGGKRNRKGDLAATFTGALMPNGDRQVIEVDSGRWTSPEMKRKLIASHDTYGAKVGVEDNGVQGWIQQDIVAETSIDVITKTTTSEKWDPATGVDSIGLELYNGKWIIPSIPDDNGFPRPATKEIGEWIREMLNFQVGAHTGDRLMASYGWRQLAAEQETRQRRRPGGIRVGGVTQANPWRQG